MNNIDQQIDIVKSKLLLLTSIENDDIKEVKNLVGKGIHLHIPDELCLKTATIHHRVKIVKFLLENGANPNPANNTTFLKAIERNNIPIIKLFIKHGANREFDNFFPLSFALFNADIEVVKTLVEYKNRDPLKMITEKNVLVACKLARLDAVEYFLSKKFDIETVKNSGSEAVYKWLEAKQLSDSLTQKLEHTKINNVVKKIKV